jgi:F0F1-type ATP synthase assembly protein I
LDDTPNHTGSAPPSSQKGKSAGTQLAQAIELPVVFVVTVVAAGGLGYFLDHLLHTKFIFMFVFGALGFFVAVREILRRLPG